MEKGNTKKKKESSWQGAVAEKISRRGVRTKNRPGKTLHRNKGGKGIGV